MKKLLLALLFCPLFAHAQSWVEGSIMGVTANTPTQEVPAALLMLDPDTPYPANVWTTITIPNIPSDTKAVYLAGLLVISNPTSVIADMHVYFKRTGYSSQVTVDFPCQALSDPYYGARTPCGVWVPVVNRQFDFWWYRNQWAVYPAGPSFGFKFYVNAYLR